VLSLLRVLSIKYFPDNFSETLSAVLSSTQCGECGSYNLHLFVLAWTIMSDSCNSWTICIPVNCVIAYCVKCIYANWYHTACSLQDLGEAFAKIRRKNNSKKKPMKSVT